MLISSLLPYVAAALAVGIFIFDTISPLQFAVAVLYVVVVLIAASYGRRRDVLIAAVSRAAIGITTLLALKNLSAIERLRETERQRANLARFFSPQVVDQLVGIDT